MRQVYTSIASLAAACVVHGRPQAAYRASCAAGWQFIVNVPFFHERRVDPRYTITKVNLQFLIREEGLAKSKCIPPTTHPPHFISNSH